MSKPLVISVILNTNRRQDTLDCLASLEENSYSNHRIIVLDNHSTDGSAEAISQHFPEVQLIHLTENLGYAGNNNVGIAEALAQGADWVFVLNEDTIFANDCLEKLVEVAESDPSIGILGPMVYHHDHDDVIQSAGGILGPNWNSIHLGMDQPDQGQFPNPHPVEWISGCGIMVRQSAIEQVGAIDERYFYFWEETEWCIRVSRGGWKIIHVPEAKMWHKGVTVDHKPKPSVTYYATRNRLLTLSKHHAPARVWAAIWVEMLRTYVSWTIKPRWRSMSEHRNAMGSGVTDFLRRQYGQMPSSQ